jgi:hypothetical protein
LASSSAFRAFPALNSWAILLAHSDSLIVILRAEMCVAGGVPSKQKAEGRKQKAESRRQKAEGRKQMLFILTSDT